MPNGGDARGLGTAVASQLILAPDPRAVRDARAFVETCCRTAGIEGDACETVVLLTSETVTNAFLHGRSEARLVVTVGHEVVLVEVSDDSSKPPKLIAQRPGALHGRGLVILDTLASGWGITEHPGGKTVWFEVRIGA